ncbi:MAG: hypothetical protein FJ202_05045 [Gemmatimonadetes bacterium]|nr:hypothetical protein [Gemmatimonadota bacterium]
MILARVLGLLLVVGGALPLAAQEQPPRPESVPEARLAIWSGRYEQGLAFLERVPRSDTAWFSVQLDIGRTYATMSRYDDAERVIRVAAASAQGRDAWTTLGEVMRERGKLAAADSAFRRAIADRGADTLVAQLRLAQLAEQRGDPATARRGYDAFIDVYNTSADRLDSREMAAVAEAVRALGATNPALFRDALRAFDRAANLDSSNLDARTALGEMFLEKFNAAEAQKTIDETLQLNERYPRALVAAAARAVFDGQPGADSLLTLALTVSPEYVPARVMVARAALDVERYADAVREAERALRTNPVDVAALGVLGAAKYSLGDMRGYDEARARAQAVNPRDATFFMALAEASGRIRRYANAAEFAERAIAADSSKWRAWALLGTNRLRLGRIADGRRALEAAFAGDPYDVWTKNTLDLLDTFKNYETTKSEHAEFMIEKAESPVLSLYLRDIAERAYVTFSKRYAFAPNEPIRIEVYRSHADFSVRTVGLAGLGALGVSFGNTLAFDSPAAKDAGPFNWASTVWHELAHTFTLGATDHRVPRWFSEGLSVWEEHQARPGWGAQLSPAFLEAIQKNRLVPVSRMNDGFMRPVYPEQIGHSYYQASLVCEWIAKEWNAAALVALLGEYKAGRTTDEAVQKVLGIDMRTMDRRFDAWMRERFARPLAAMAQAGPEYAAGMQAEQLKAVADSLKGSWRAQMAAADALARIGDRADAIRLLERAHALIPEFGGDGSPADLLAAAYIARSDTAKAIAMLKVVAVGDEAAFDANVQLAVLALATRDSATAFDALDRAVLINPFPAEHHHSLAVLAAARKDLAVVVREREAIVALDPVDKATAYYDLAVAYRDVGNAASAKRAALRALEDAPNFTRAQELLLQIVDGRTP